MNETNRNLKFQINHIIDLYKKGSLEEAKNSTLHLLKTNSNVAFLHNLLGAINYGLNNLDEAKNNYKKATLIDKNYSEAFNNLGAVLIELNILDQAQENLYRALKLNSNLIDTYINLGKLSSKHKNYNQEIIYYKKALEINPKSDIANNNIAAVYISKGDLVKAKNFLEKTVQINPKFFQALTNIGGIYLAEGDKETAIKFYKKAIEVNPNYAEAYRLLADNCKIDLKESIMLQMLKINKKNDLILKDKMHINFALGRVYDNLDKNSLAFNHYTIGNRIKKKLLKYNIKKDREIFNLIKLNYKKIKYRYENIEKFNNFKTPVFIVGMPRSGTTLVEQIISSHSGIYGAGELSIVEEILVEIEWKKAKTDKKFIETFREKYLKKITTIDTEKLVISDKMPTNFRWLGIILSAIPEAKIIHTTRDPKATMWSIFKHYFTSDGNGYAYDLHDTLQYYSMYQDLMLFWNKHFFNQIYICNYEKLVANQEIVTRELINFLDVDWEKDCLEFYNNKRITHTASATQVRKKIYQGSSDEWQKYRDLLPNSFLKF